MILDRIVETKREEVAERKAKHPFATLRRAAEE
ncbi:MAG: indole-3-glycerol phosphate synthase, partial [Gemmatimonadetes bacterium]|nr:indole-3-glycerol phosphate synthase [Gemmatimonadota bacterium]